MSTFSVQDVGAADVFKDKKFSLEAEISRKDATTFLKKHGNRYGHDYTGHIWEMENLHDAPKETLDDFLKLCEEEYSYHLPWGNDTYVSGGNHLHLFVNHETLEHLYHRWGNTDMSRLYDWHRYCPLYALFHDGKFFHRRQNRQSMCNIWSTNSKGSFATLKNAYTSVDVHRESDYCEECNSWDCGCMEGEVSTNDLELYSVEFRLNQVLDPRIVGYYLGILMLSEMKVEPSRPVNGTDFDKVVSGIQISYDVYRTDEVAAKEEVDVLTGYYGQREVVMRPKFDIRENPEHGVAVDMGIVKANLFAILALLKQTGMVKAHKDLCEYVFEKAILTPED